MNKNLLERYSRQIILPEIGIPGQQRISNAKVLCIGAGGLGSSILQYLAASGVGTIGIVEYDQVDITNLHRQILYTSHDLGKSKLDCAIKYLSTLNSNVELKAFNTKLTANNAYEIIRDFDIVIDGTDNFAAKFIINDCAVKIGIPMVYASIFKFEGQVATFFAPKGACYRCLYPEPPRNYIPNCAENGVLGPLVGIIGSMQALECIKIILKQATISKLFIINGINMHTSQYTINKSPNCSICTKIPENIKLYDYDNNCLYKNITASKLKSELSQFLVIDVREQQEIRNGIIPNAIHLPLSNLTQHENSSLDLLQLNGKYNKTCIYCQHGVRSVHAIKILHNLGITNLYNLNGGYAAWNCDSDCNSKGDYYR